MFVIVLVLLLFLGGLLVLVALAIWAVTRSRPGIGGPRDGTNRALGILQERYARGEISREEYEGMRRDLMT